MAEDMSLEEVISTHIETRGGLEAIQGMESAKLVGNMNMGGMEAPFTMEFKRPNKIRTEFTMQGMTGVMAYDGETGWAIMPFMGKNDPEKMVRRSAQASERSGRSDRRHFGELGGEGPQGRARRQRRS